MNEKEMLGNTKGDKTYFLTLVNDGYGQLTWSKKDYCEDLESLQKEVGGLIQCAEWFFPNLQERNIDTWVNEEGKLEGLPITTILKNDGNLLEVLVGNLCFIRHDDEGNSFGLTEEDVDFVKSEIKRILTKPLTNSGWEYSLPTGYELEVCA